MKLRYRHVARTRVFWDTVPDRFGELDGFRERELSRLFQKIITHGLSLPARAARQRTTLWVSGGARREATGGVRCTDEMDPSPRLRAASECQSRVPLSANIVETPDEPEIREGGDRALRRRVDLEVIANVGSDLAVWGGHLELNPRETELPSRAAHTEEPR